MEKQKSKAEKHLSGAQKLWIGIAVIALLLILLCAGLWLLKIKLFEENDHFVMREIILSRPDGLNNTYWNSEQNREKRIGDLEKELQIQPGITNLFALDLSELRKILLQNHPEIGRVNIRRQLPDQLLFEIYERLPAANIGPRRGAPVLEDRYIDEEGFVFSSAFCEKTKLPQIIDMNDQETGLVRPGEGPLKTDGIRLALDFIGLVNRSYPELRISSITLVASVHRVQCAIRYRSREYTVLLPYPMSAEKLRNDIMGRLMPVLTLQHRNNDPRSIIDLQYQDQAVVKPRSL